MEGSGVRGSWCSEGVESRIGARGSPVLPGSGRGGLGAGGTRGWEGRAKGPRCSWGKDGGDSQCYGGREEGRGSPGREVPGAPGGLDRGSVLLRAGGSARGRRERAARPRPGPGPGSGSRGGARERREAAAPAPQTFPERRRGHGPRPALSTMIAAGGCLGAGLLLLAALCPPAAAEGGSHRGAPGGTGNTGNRGDPGRRERPPRRDFAQSFARDRPGPGGHREGEPGKGGGDTGGVTERAPGGQRGWDRVENREGTEGPRVGNEGAPGVGPGSSGSGSWGHRAAGSGVLGGCTVGSDEIASSGPSPVPPLPTRCPRFSPPRAARPRCPRAATARQDWGPNWCVLGGAGATGEALPAAPRPLRRGRPPVPLSREEFRLRCCPEREPLRCSRSQGSGTAGRSGDGGPQLVGVSFPVGIGRLRGAGQARCPTERLGGRVGASPSLPSTFSTCRTQPSPGGSGEPGPTAPGPRPGTAAGLAGTRPAGDGAAGPEVCTSTPKSWTMLPPCWGGSSSTECFESECSVELSRCEVVGQGRGDTPGGLHSWHPTAHSCLEGLCGASFWLGTPRVSPSLGLDSCPAAPAPGSPVGTWPTGFAGHPWVLHGGTARWSEPGWIGHCPSQRPARDLGEQTSSQGTEPGSHQDHLSHLPFAPGKPQHPVPMPQQVWAETLSFGRTTQRHVPFRGSPFCTAGRVGES